jgi:hypothetical protein
MCAARDGHLEIVRVLLEAKANPDLIAKKGGWSPLLLASHGDNQEIISLLLNQTQANIHQVSEEGASCLEIAAILNQTKTVEYLLESKADPIQVNSKNGSTALLQAAKYGHLDVAGLLLEAKSNIEAEDSKNCRPLDAAIYHKKLEMVVFLLMHGAELTHFANLSVFLQTIDQLDENLLQCLKVIPKDRIPTEDEKEAKLYTEKLENLQTVCREADLAVLAVMDGVLPKDLGKMVISYGRYFVPHSTVKFFKSATVDTALEDLQQQIEKYKKISPGC